MHRARQDAVNAHGKSKRTNERTNERQDTHVGIEGVAFPLEHKRRWLRLAAPIHPLISGHDQFETLSSNFKKTP